MAKEKNLTNVTSIAAADFARLVTSAGASVKATAANLAKYVIETYNGSSVAGSSQSVKAALDSLNSNQTKASNVNTAGRTFTLPNNYRGTLFIHDSAPDRCGVYMVYTTSGGVAGTKTISTANDITMNNSTNNKLTITPTSGSRVVMFLNAQGTVTV